MNIRKNNILQLKLSNGEEILCELIEVPSDENVDEDYEIIVRNCLSITKVQVSGDKVFCMLKPWLSFQDMSENNLASLNPQHIIVRCIPCDDIMTQYLNAVDHCEDENTSGISINDEDRLDASTWMDRLGLAKSNIIEMYDSDENIINFPKGLQH